MMLRAAVIPHLRALNISIGAPIRSPIAYTSGTEVRIRASTTMEPRSSTSTPSASTNGAELARSPVPTKTKSARSTCSAPSAVRTRTPVARPSPMTSTGCAPSRIVMPRVRIPSTT